MRELTFAGQAFLVLAAGCQSDTENAANAVGRVSTDQVEQACAERLSQRAGVPMNAVRAASTNGSTEGAMVELNLYGATWNCRADPQGNVLDLEFQGKG